MAAYGPTEPLKSMDFQRRALGPKDVAIKIHYCGVCHSDIHTIRGDWGKIQYPQIVGHEVTGKVVAAGSSVSRFKPGARVGVGTMVNSCRHCSECASGFENYCLNGNTQIYGSKDKDGTITQGGYSTFIVVDEDFVLDIPDPIDLADAGPLLCAGITVYHPLRRWGVSPGKRVAIVGMGGLGHLAVKFAKAMGAEVTVFTTTPGKTATPSASAPRTSSSTKTAPTSPRSSTRSTSRSTRSRTSTTSIDSFRSSSPARRTAGSGSERWWTRMRSGR